jgi:hypothetical protein
MESANGGESSILCTVSSNLSIVRSPDRGPTCKGPCAMSAASVDGFSGRRALVASAVDAWAIRGPGLLLKQGLIECSGSSRGGSSGRERNGECKGTTGRRGWCDVVSGYTVERVQRQRGDERVRARVVRGIGREARFRGYSVVYPYKGFRDIIYTYPPSLESIYRATRTVGGEIQMKE